MKIVILDDYQDAVRRLDCFAKMKGHDVTVFNDTVKEIDILVKRMKTADAAVLIRERTKITDALLKKLPHLRLISQTGNGISHIDLDACTQNGVAVAAGGGSPFATAELAWGLILAAMRNIPLEDRGMREGKWQKTIGQGLRGKTLGIFGYGRIGKEVALVGKTFGMQVLAWGREGSLERARADGFEVASGKRDLFEKSDVLSLHIKLTPETKGIVSAHDLSQMKPTSLRVNTSRAPLIEEGALASALRAGRPGSAAVDIYEEEPVLGGDYPLLQMKNTVCTPHLGYVEWSTYEEFFGAAFERVAAFAAGRPAGIKNPGALAGRPPA